MFSPCQSWACACISSSRCSVRRASEWVPVRGYHPSLWSSPHTLTTKDSGGLRRCTGVLAHRPSTSRSPHPRPAPPLATQVFISTFLQGWLSCGLGESTSQVKSWREPITIWLALCTFTMDWTVEAVCVKLLIQCCSFNKTKTLVAFDSSFLPCLTHSPLVDGLSSY